MDNQRASRTWNGDDDAESFELAGRVVEIRTIRSPIRDTPNQDAALVVPVGNDGLVLAVADGLGGAPSGREASRLVIDTLAQALEAADGTSEQLRTTILDAIEAANRALIDSGSRGSTTLVVAEIVGRKLRSYHVGDSELLVCGQRGRIKMRIVPHSPTGFAVEAGLLDEQEAVLHEERHVVFNVVGAAGMSIDVSAPLNLAPRDTVLLASDGLFDNLYVDEIVAIVRAGALSRAMRRLVESASERMLAWPGGYPAKPDDLSIILCRERPPRRAG